jgi:hypothetical protein
MFIIFVNIITITLLISFSPLSSSFAFCSVSMPPSPAAGNATYHYHNDLRTKDMPTNQPFPKERMMMARIDRLEDGSSMLQRGNSEGKLSSFDGT